VNPNSAPAEGSSTPHAASERYSDPSGAETANGPQTGTEGLRRHSCSNCDGVDPDTCPTNPGRQAEPTALRDRCAAAIEECRVLTPGALADAVLAVRDAELEHLRERLADAGEDITAAVRQRKAAEDRAHRTEAALDRVRTLATATRDATAPGRNDWQIGQHDLAITVLAALDEPEEQP
jgi:hypothetical protein